MLLGPLFVCIIFGVFYHMGRVLERFGFYKWIMRILCIGHFLFLVFAIYHYWFKTGWDAAIVTWSAKAIATEDWNSVGHEYMSIYPNNVLLACIEAFAIKIGSVIGINYYLSMIIQQCAIFALVGYILFLALDEICGTRTAVGGYGLYMLFVGLSPWVVVPYSDGLGILLPVIMFYVFCMAKYEKWQTVACVTLPFLTYIGYKLKPQIAIMGVAVIMALVLRMWEQGSWKGPWLKRIAYMGSGLMVAILVNFACLSISHVEIDPQKHIGGISHYFMMGLSSRTGGVCDPDDIAFSLSFDNLEERKSANWQRAAERMEEMGALGLLQFWNKKVAMTYSDGTLGWWGEGSFYQEEQYTGNQRVRSFFTDLYYKGGNAYKYYVEAMQYLWIGMLVISLGVICKGRDVPVYQNALILSIIGLTLFEMLFEARSRYLFTYAPIFVILASVGLQCIADFWKRRTGGRDAR